MHLCRSVLRHWCVATGGSVSGLIYMKSAQDPNRKSNTSTMKPRNPKCSSPPGWLNTRVRLRKRFARRRQAGVHWNRGRRDTTKRQRTQRKTTITPTTPGHIVAREAEKPENRSETRGLRDGPPDSRTPACHNTTRSSNQKNSRYSTTGRRRDE